MKFLLNWLLTSIAVAIAAWLVPGIEPFGAGAAWVSFAFVGLSLGLINALIKPIVSAISIPVTFLTLGIFQLVINSFMLTLASNLSVSVFGEGIFISGFWSAFFGAIVVSIVSGILNAAFGD